MKQTRRNALRVTRLTSDVENLCSIIARVIARISQQPRTRKAKA